MPVGMTLCLALVIALASTSADSRPWSWAGVAAIAASLIFTIVINVPINLATRRWDPQHPPALWEHHRGRWELGQGRYPRVRQREVQRRGAQHVTGADL